MMLVCEGVLISCENVGSIVVVGSYALVQLVETGTCIVLLKVSTRISPVCEVGGPAGVPVLVEPVCKIGHD